MALKVSVFMINIHKQTLHFHIHQNEIVQDASKFSRRSQSESDVSWTYSGCMFYA